MQLPHGYTNRSFRMGEVVSKYYQGADAEERLRCEGAALQKGLPTLLIKIKHWPTGRLHQSPRRKLLRGASDIRLPSCYSTPINQTKRGTIMKVKTSVKAGNQPFMPGQGPG